MSFFVHMLYMCGGGNIEVVYASFSVSSTEDISKVTNYCHPQQTLYPILSTYYYYIFFDNALYTF